MEKYLSPVSGRTVTTVFPSPSSRAIRRAAVTFVPLEMRELLVEYINDYYDNLLDDEDYDEDEYENVAD